MKKFSAFLTEAEKSFAAKSAQTLKLKHVGYGRYADASGNVTHMSKDGKLVKVDPKNPDITPNQQNGEEETGDGSGAVDQGTISITFGRFNPPTVGHEKLLAKVAREAKSNGGEYRIYPSRSEDPKKNPLDAGTKIKYMRMAYPDHANAIVDNGDMRTIFDVLTALDSDGYSSVNIVVGGDRVSEFNSLAQKYNGELYTFDEIKVTSAGERDPDAEGVEGMSASKMRKAAAEDDFDAFSQGTPEGLGKDGSEKLFLTLRQAMKVEEYGDFADASFQLYEIAPKLDPKGMREAYFDNKMFPVGTFVENVNTGILGKVVSRGSNYIIYIDEQESVYRGWFKDLIERNDIKFFNFTPAGEMGTDKLANYMRKLTPGEFIRKINKKDKDA
ncbi:cytidylyltransferase [Cyanophage S-RIM12_RW_29_1109]|uniref:Cytidylyltransferase n=4 Tax=Brizovirus syn33 TaxID=2734097 RepID=A0A1D7STA0_9CAUD|nr:cytidyltransferase [Prochlorococcus phage Syn33]AOO15658.1 cytidylyltransferase [Cyanophage S-RIM12_Np_22_1112]AOO16299.1 cytidylyltransferase [Cyanophage S-RIM12_RW_04_0709]AOO16730.1 cytidylyltransferase [Cyanophage S-RIM12_RW_07_1112]AOO16945.1 cytidylyltransferase [Cyanophage S-RIM12_RW_14_0101]AOO17161.1 cytidylyltransferase [Cyanophage S-RIM12_RW_22_0110]AOO17376.1 cytidylyltransferase [Cyanophage S-RIM12_RW_25_0210]AOO17591.1 cytidylyltransferase [Cyanophage S-RIM12]AOO18022.1 cyt